MKLKELKNIIKFSFDFADDEIDAVFYVELEAINEKYLKQIEVVLINQNYIVCKFTDFIRRHKTAIKKYLIKNYHDEEALDYLINHLIIADDITEDGGEAVWHFLEYDIADFLTQD